MNWDQVTYALKNNIDEKLRYFSSKFFTDETMDIEEPSIIDTAKIQPEETTLEAMAQEVQNLCEENNALFLNDEHEIGMACDLKCIPEKQPLPSKLVIQQCSTKKQFKDFGKVLASVSNLEEEQVELFYELVAHLPPNQRTEIVFFVGYINKKPVSTCCLFFTDVAGLYDLATIPQQRAKGYGTALFYHALKAAKKRGYQIAVLQATEDGINIYERFGFREICNFMAYC